jgi:hypothetical protein
MLVVVGTNIDSCVGHHHSLSWSKGSYSLIQFAPTTVRSTAQPPGRSAISGGTSGFSTAHPMQTKTGSCPAYLKADLRERQQLADSGLSQDIVKCRAEVAVQHTINCGDRHFCLRHVNGLSRQRLQRLIVKRVRQVRGHTHFGTGIRTASEMTPQEQSNLINGLCKKASSFRRVMGGH